MNIKKETIQKYIDEVEQHLANKDFKSALDIAGRYHLDQNYIICLTRALDESPSSLRKYIDVDDFDEIFPFSLIDLVDEGNMSISKAEQVVKRVQTEKRQKEELKQEQCDPKILDDNNFKHAA